MDSMTIIGIIIGILVLIVAFQTIQLIGINSRMTGATVTTEGSTPSQTTQGSQSQTQLPTQRGGC